MSDTSNEHGYTPRNAQEAFMRLESENQRRKAMERLRVVLAVAAVIAIPVVLTLLGVDWWPQWGGASVTPRYP